MSNDEQRECRHCGWLCQPNDQPLKKTYPVEQPKPVAWLTHAFGHEWIVTPEKVYKHSRPLYDAPLQKEWQGITPLDWNRDKHDSSFIFGVEWAEAILKGKNDG